VIVVERFRPDGDDGTAVIEFVVLVVLLIVPFVYLVLCVFEVERAAFAVTTATRESARAYVTAPSGDEADERAADVRDAILADHGITSPSETRLRCSAQPCLSPGAQVRVRTTVQVPLPFVPAWGSASPATVRVSAEHVAVVDEYRAVRP
jgi:Flp pilus assembly protein TadG